MNQALYAHMNNKRKMKKKKRFKQQMNEIKKTVQDMKEERNKDTEILKMNQSEMNSSIAPIKFSIESLVNRVKQVSRTEDKVEEVDQTVKEQEKS
jgi:hypothetical protein